jgi:hypothetical protein
MAASSFAVVLAVAAALLALWLDQRFEGRRPASLRRTMTHGLLALLAGQGGAPFVAHLLASPDASSARRMTTVLAIFLPSLTYTFIAAFWLLRHLADSATRVHD